MKESEAKQIVALLLAAYGREMRKETVALYTMELQPLPFDVTKVVVGGLIRTSRFLPTIAEIIGGVGQAALGAPTAEQGWERVQRLMFECVYYNGHGWQPEPNYGHPMVQRTVAAMGGLRAMQSSTNESVMRAQFLRLYTSFVSDQIVPAARGELEAPARRELEAGS